MFCCFHSNFSYHLFSFYIIIIIITIIIIISLLSSIEYLWSLIFFHINPSKIIFSKNIFQLPDRNRGRTEVSLFNSYYTEV